jgi:two-component SAPR family response regulator
MKRRMILVVDEDETSIDLIERTLNSPYRVLRVREGKRAIGLARQEGIEIAIVARCLPDIDGLAVLKTLTLKNPSISVIFVAYAPTNDLIISAFRSGAKDFLEKPIDPDSLMESINRVISATCKNQDTGIIVTKPGVHNNNKLFSSSKPYKFRVNTWFSYLRELFSHFLVPPKKADLESVEWQHEVVNNAKTAASYHLSTEKSKRHSANKMREEISENWQSEEEQARDFVPALSLCCLGKFRVILNGQVMENWTNRKGRELFTFLVINHKRRTYRDVLMDTFWQNSDPDSARNSMNVTIHCVRSALHKVNPDYEYILFKDECYFLNPEIEVWVDVGEFLKYWKNAQSTEREKGLEAAIGEYELAAALYKGDFMEDDLYENWPGSERENFKEIYLFILDRLSEYYSQDGKPSTAARLCETILEKDNCREDIHRRLMRCYYKLEQRDKAAKQFRKCVEALKAELEVDPTRATIELYEQIKQGSLNIEEKIK